MMSMLLYRNVILQTKTIILHSTKIISLAEILENEITLKSTPHSLLFTFTLYFLQIGNQIFCSVIQLIWIPFLKTEHNEHNEFRESPKQLVTKVFICFRQSDLIRKKSIGPWRHSLTIAGSALKWIWTFFEEKKIKKWNVPVLL